MISPLVAGASPTGGTNNIVGSNRRLHSARREKAAVTVFSQSRDVEAGHANLYKKALNNLITQRSTKYYVCTVCGHIAEREPPERCPICSAPKSKFEEIE